MESSRRAVESYWRSRMIDGATSDEDKVTPVYKLEEICDLLRSSHISIVKEVSEFILKRLQHKSPIVKQKALRVIKYAVGKAGVEFRREMQRHSVAVRQLIHHKGQPDPLKGDALNKAVRDTAQEALSAIFAADDNNTPAPAESLTQRIQGFGNTNFETPSDDKKSFLSEVVGIGSATIKQGLNSFTQVQSQTKSDTGSYKSPNLRRSLTTEIKYSDRDDRVEHYSEVQSSSRFSNVADGAWGQDLKSTPLDATNGNPSSSYSNDKSREERFLETLVAPGGVRLQPTRDALQAFLTEASKLNAVALSHALELKLQSHLWQVRMKAICVLEAILRKQDDEHLFVVSSYFSENTDVVVKCSESPQASLREKASKVLSLLNGEQSASGVGQPENYVKTETTANHMPDLIDTYDLDGNEDSVAMQRDDSIATMSSSTPSLFDDLYNDGLDTGVSNSKHKNNDDPFADVSFHAQSEKEEHLAADLFSGMATVDKAGVAEGHMAASRSGPELFDFFGSNSGLPQAQENPKKDVSDFMAGLSIKGNDSLLKQNGASSGGLSDFYSTRDPSHQVSNDVLNGILGSQAAGVAANPLLSMGPVAYNTLSSGLVFNPAAFPSQPINYGAMGSLFAQQQFLSTMSNFQQMGNLPFQYAGASHASETQVGGNPPPLPDIFNPSIPAQTPSSMANSSKKEETRAFDFISDHLAAARDPKRVN